MKLIIFSISPFINGDAFTDTTGMGSSPEGTLFLQEKYDPETQNNRISMNNFFIVFLLVVQVVIRIYKDLLFEFLQDNFLFDCRDILQKIFKIHDRNLSQ